MAIKQGPFCMFHAGNWEITDSASWPGMPEEAVQNCTASICTAEAAVFVGFDLNHEVQEEHDRGCDSEHFASEQRWEDLFPIVDDRLIAV